MSLNHASDSYVNWLNDEEVNRFLESGGDYTMVKLKDFLYEVEKSEILFWAIHLRESGKHIGNIKGFIGIVRNGATAITPIGFSILIFKLNIPYQTIFQYTGVIICLMASIPFICQRFDSRLSQ